MIDREHLIKLINDACAGCARYKAEDIADTLLSEGVVTVIRCKDCIHNYGIAHSCEFNPHDIVCDYWESDGLDGNDFCSHGELKLVPVEGTKKIFPKYVYKEVDSYEL